MARKNKVFGIVMLSAYALLHAALAAVAETDPARWVDPMIGTQNGGNCFPGPAWPFGAAQPGPDTDRSPRQFGHPSGYDNRDPYLQGFSQGHLNGTGCCDLGNLRLLPFEAGTITGAVHQSADWKKSEHAECGFYAVDLKDLGVGVEITAARKAAIYRWTFRDGKARVLVDCRWGTCTSEERLHESVASDHVAFSGSQTRMTGALYGWQWAYRKSFFALEFSRPWTSFEELPRLPRKRGGLDESGRYIFSFDLKPGEALLAKVALLPSDEAGAVKTLSQEIPGWDFEKVRRDCRDAWNDILGRAAVEGTDKQKRIWNTALYHLCLQPNDIADCDGRYRSFKAPGCKYHERDIYVAKRGVFYSTFSLWDTFRAAAPFYTLLVPERVGGFLDSLLEQERHQGCLPVWPLWGSETWGMPGCHSVPVFVDAYLKGIRDFDIDAAYTAITNTLKDGRWMDVDIEHRGHWKQIAKYGYLPFDIAERDSVSTLLEYGYDDACAARFARALGHTEDAAFFERRAFAWTNIFDKTTNLCRGRDSKGAWREPFDEFAQGWYRSKNGVDYCEGNAWQYQYHVMQHPQTLIDLQGGSGAFVKRLDMYFSRKAVDSKGRIAEPLTLFGQYQHGNEPSHHVAYFYQYAGRPDRTQELVRRITDVHYEATPWGVPGNDDCGQTSAWYLFTAMGFYPFDPCGGEYVLGAPQLPKIQLKMKGEDGRWNVFSVVAKGLSKENKYVGRVMLNGRPLTGWKIRHADIMKGGELVFEMCGTAQRGM